VNIKEFKVGDIITRNEGMKYAHNGSVDGSWCGDRLILKGHDPVSKIIFLEHADGVFEGDVTKLSYARDAWDEGWCTYPESIYQKIKSKM
jgi:hypothetical protein